VSPGFGGAVDVCASLSVARELGIPTHPAPDVRLGVDRPDRSRVTLAAWSKEQLPVAKGWAEPAGARPPRLGHDRPSSQATPCAGMHMKLDR
jgi:hypothetical protein